MKTIKLNILIEAIDNFMVLNRYADSNRLNPELIKIYKVSKMKILKNEIT
jgi:hypothetical protein